VTDLKTELENELAEITAEIKELEVEIDAIMEDGVSDPGYLTERACSA
jgi:hypothetical protein